MTGCASVPGWLLIFDNADAVEDIRAVAAGRAAAAGDPRSCDRDDPPRAGSPRWAGCWSWT